jgi:hypothetical protein
VQRYFAAWSQVAFARRYKHTLAISASAFRTQSLKKTCLSEWMRHLQSRIASGAVLQSCTKIRKQHLLSCTFQRWATRFRNSKLTRECEYLHHRNLQAKHFTIWCNTVQDTRYRQEKFLQLWKRKLLRHHFSLWRMFTLQSHKRGQISLLISLHHESTLLQSAYGTWTKALQWRREIEKAYTTCTTMHQAQIVQHSWATWLTARHARKEKQKRATLHLAFQTRKLLHSAFSSWVTQWKKAHVCQMQHNLCKATYRNGLLQRAFGRWINTCKAKEAVRKVINLREEARKRRAVESAFTAWMLTSQRSKEVRQKAVLCVAMCTRNLLHDAMAAWLRVLQRNLAKKKWLTFRHNTLTSKAFRNWKTFTSKRLSIVTLSERFTCMSNTRYN